MNVCAIILAAGLGSRMKSDVTKQRMMLGNTSVIKRTVLAFDRCEKITGIVVVARAEEIDFMKAELSSIGKLVSVVIGGKSRAESAKLGFLSIPKDAELVAIHDGARALITEEMISSVVAKAEITGAATAASYVTDTVKCVDSSMRITGTMNRDSLMRAETPQVFDVKIYKDALEAIGEGLFTVTDDNMLVEKIGKDVYCVGLDGCNLKITTPSDIDYAEFILRKRGMLDV